MGKINMNSFDLLISNYFSSIRSGGLTELMYLLSRLFDFSGYFVVMVFLVALLIYLIRNLQYAVFFVLSLSVGAISVYFLKMFFNISRPLNMVTNAFGQSFPSYHAAIASIFFILIVYIFGSLLKGFVKILFNSLCAFLILLISFSRVYLGVHWASDIFAGIALGAILSYAFIFIFRHVRNTHIHTSMLR